MFRVASATMRSACSARAENRAGSAGSTTAQSGPAVTQSPNGRTANAQKMTERWSTACTAVYGIVHRRRQGLASHVDQLSDAEGRVLFEGSFEADPDRRIQC